MSVAKEKTMPDWIGISALMILIFALGYAWGRLDGERREDDGKDITRGA